MVRWSKSGGIALTCSRSSRENDNFLRIDGGAKKAG
jgi:hypothetical protein